MPTGAEWITRNLEAAGVEVVFGLPGVHNLALWDALRRSSIRLVGVRHEQAAAYAADGYARATGRIGVALTTTGPGAANTLGAVGEAWASRSPILVIATDIPSGLRREGVYRGVLHETDGQADMFRPVVDLCCFGAQEIDAALSAVQTPPHRPVYLEVPTDELSSEVHERSRVFQYQADSGDSAADAGELLLAAERPVVWVGSGGRDAGDAIGELATSLCAPVLTTYGARGVLPPSHPCVVCLPPHAEPAGRLWDEADVVIAIGTDFDGMNTQNWLQPQPPKLIAVNLDGDDATKNYAADVTLVGNAAEVVADLVPQVQPRAGVDELARRLHRARGEACDGLDPRALRFLDALSFALPDDAVVVADMCIPGYWIGVYHTFHHPRKLLYPVGWGTLGFGFPASLGAALAGTGPTVAICGDGGFLFACGELATVAQERIPLTTVIVDDGGYGMLRYDQDLAGSERFGVDLVTPDFEAMAAAFGIRAQTVEGLDDDFGAALAEHVLDAEPSVLVARAEALTPPPNTSPNWYRKRA